MGQTKYDSGLIQQGQGEADVITIVIERDYRITGAFRDQSDNVEAPVGFEGISEALPALAVYVANEVLVNSRWKVCEQPEPELDRVPNHFADGTPNALDETYGLSHHLERSLTGRAE